jgi:hypothetical protein
VGHYLTTTAKVLTNNCGFPPSIQRGSFDPLVGSAVDARFVKKAPEEYAQLEPTQKYP